MGQPAKLPELYFILFLLHAALLLPAQDPGYVKQVVDTLTSKTMAGRGYVNNGSNIAADYIAKEYEKWGLLPFRSSYFQQVTFPVNTFPGKLDVQLDGHPLEPGKDFLVEPYSGYEKGKIDGTFETIRFKKRILLKPERFDRKITKPKAKGKVLVIDLDDFKEKKHQTALQETLNKIKTFQGFELNGILLLTSNKLTWTVSTWYTAAPFITIQKDSVQQDFDSISLHIENRFISNFLAHNVIGYIPGKTHPDSFIVITAHYDHLGHMGAETYFPGANDNASGTAMLLDYARHYSQPENRPAYSIAFMGFAAEEAGLIGSHHYVKYPLFPLERIKFLLNFDLMGDGEENITVVNGTALPAALAQLKAINEKKDYVRMIKARGNAPNSDHYHFALKGVPAFFTYTEGPYKEYHSITDDGSRLTFADYEDIFRLFRDFIEVR